MVTYKKNQGIRYLYLMVFISIPFLSLAKVQIKISFSENSSMRVFSFYYPSELELDGNKDIVVTKGHKKAEIIDVELETPTFFKFHINKGGPFDFISLLIYPDDTLTITFDNQNKMFFSGTREKEWNFENKLPDWGINFAELYKKSLSDYPFTAIVTQSSKREINKLDSLCKNAVSLSSETLYLLKNEQIYHHLYALLVNHKGIKNSHDEEFNNYIKYLYKHAINSNNYNGSILFGSSLYLGADFLDTNRDKEFKFENLINNIRLTLPPKQRDLVTMNLIKEQIRINFDKTQIGLEKITQIISEFKKYASNENYITILESLLKSDKLTADLKTLYNSEEKLFSSDGMSLKWQELINNNDKYNILIDVWATWCIPCIKGINSMVNDTLFKNTKNFKVVFISIDKSLKDWSNGTAKMQMEDFENYKIDPDSKIFELLAFDRAVPRYILLRNNGTSQTLDNFSPSDSNSKNMIMELLKE